MVWLPRILGIIILCIQCFWYFDRKFQKQLFKQLVDIFYRFSEYSSTDEKQNENYVIKELRASSDNPNRSAIEGNVDLIRRIEWNVTQEISDEILKAAETYDR